MVSLFPLFYSHPNPDKPEKYEIRSTKYKTISNDKKTNDQKTSDIGSGVTPVSVIQIFEFLICFVF